MISKTEIRNCLYFLCSVLIFSEFMIPEAKEGILLYLMRENYPNEERFKRSYIRWKFYIKSWGKTKIKMHLKQKGITEKFIVKSFDEID